MSQENVEIVRRSYKAIASGDYEKAARALHADAEWHNTSVYPGPRTIRGADGIRDFLEDMFDTYVGLGMTIERVASADDVVVIQLHGWGHGKTSGAPVDVRWAHAIRLQEGKMIRVQTFGRYSSALEAAGLSE
jgi:ketosteroid isomerase-like protein